MIKERLVNDEQLGGLAILALVMMVAGAAFAWGPAAGLFAAGLWILVCVAHTEVVEPDR